MYRLGIDVGGTNTDAVLVDENRRVAAEVKYPTSGDVYEGIIGAVRAVLAGGMARAMNRFNAWTPVEESETNQKKEVLS